MKQQRWVAPPNWPQPPAGWQPPPGWQPDPAWGPAPAGWTFWQSGPSTPERRERALGWAIAGLLLVGGCAAVANGDDQEDVTAPQERPPSSPATPASPRVTAPSDPLATPDNKLACSRARADVSSRAQAFTDLQDGSALPSDTAAVAGEVQKDVNGLATFASGAIRRELLNVGQAYGRIRVALITQDLGLLNRAVEQQVTSLEDLNKLCTRIGE